MKNKLCILAFLLLSQAILFSQKKADKNRTLFKESSHIKNIEQLAGIAGQYTYFFTGENHEFTKDNSIIELSFLEYLNQHAGVRHLIIELGFSRGYMINCYINNDSTYLNELEKTTDYSHLDFYTKLRELNQKLPPAQKITVHGVDVERFPDDGPMLLKRLLPYQKPVPDAIGLTVEVIRTYAYYNSVRYSGDYYDDYYDRDNYYGNGFNDKKCMDTLISDYNRNKSVFKSYLGDSFALFDKVFSSLAECRKWENYNRLPYQEVYRERKIIENITALHEDDSIAKFYGQFGRCHTSKTTLNRECDWLAFNSTAKRLNEGIGKGKTLTIGIFYKDDIYNNFYDDETTTEQLIPYIDSPCNNSNILIRVKEKDSMLTQHFNYILLNNICRNVRKDVYQYELPSGTNYSADNYEIRFDMGAGYSYFNLNNLNNGMQLTDKKFMNQIPTLHIGFANVEDNFFNSYKFNYLLPQQINKGHLNYKLKGYSIEEGIGYSPNISHKFHISLYMDMAFQHLALLTENDSTVNLQTQGFSDLKSRYKFINNSFSLGAGADMRFMFSENVGIFIHSRYLKDLSSQYWRQNINGTNYTIKGSPRTSLSNYNIIAGICFAFD